jgi:hypothetical protein
MDNFNFEKVQKVMEFLKWKWAPIGNEVPEVYQIRQSARRLLKDAIKIESSLSTGGLAVRYKKHSNGDISLELSFEIDEWRTYVNEAMSEREYKEYQINMNKSAL